eukprot:10060968-Alexandrium_andersonii.AAC.1
MQARREKMPEEQHGEPILPARCDAGAWPRTCDRSSPRWGCGVPLLALKVRVAQQPPSKGRT